jgi:hypothetical protein
MRLVNRSSSDLDRRCGLWLVCFGSFRFCRVSVVSPICGPPVLLFVLVVFLPFLFFFSHLHFSWNGLPNWWVALSWSPLHLPALAGAILLFVIVIQLSVMNTYQKMPDSGVPTSTENVITCISCGKLFPFSETVEGRCYRDHANMLTNERRQLQATIAAQRSYGGPQPVVIQGPTVNIANQQSTNATAIANSSNGRGYVPVDHCCHGVLFFLSMGMWLPFWLCAWYAFLFARFTRLSLIPISFIPIFFHSDFPRAALDFAANVRAAHKSFFVQRSTRHSRLNA